MKKIFFVLGLLLIFMSAQIFAANRVITLDIKDFSGIKVAGDWNVVVKQGEKYAVKLTVSDETVDRLDVNKQGNVLVLHLKPRVNLFSSFTTLTAEITLPKLEFIDSKGSSDITFSGFNSKNFEIHSAGSSNIKGADNTITNLTVNLLGSSDIDLKKSNITNADVNMKGSGNLALNMADGKLTGNIFGSGNIVVLGEMKEQSVKIKGSGNVEYR